MNHYYSEIKAGEKLTSVLSADNSTTLEWTEVDVKGVSITNVPAESIPVNGSVTLGADFEPDYATYKTVTWSSSNPNVATIDNEGKITGKAAGQTTITATATNGTDATSDDKKTTCTVTVSKGAGSISYKQTSVSRSFGDTEFTNELQIVGDGSVSYSSSNEKIASVDGAGQVTIRDIGQTTITATVTDSDNYEYAEKTASYTLTVAKCDMDVNGEQYNGVYDGYSHGITVTVTKPADGYTIKYGTSQDACNLDASPTITDVAESPLTVYYNVTADKYNTKTGSATVTLSKAAQDAPAAPTKASATINSITLTSIENGEYSLGGTNWQSSPTFTGLSMNTDYTFYQRLKEDANHNASASSAAATIKTKNHVHEWTYTAKDATITATCGNSDKGHGEPLTATLTVNSPARTTYGGNESAAATITGTIDGVTNPDIVYKKEAEELSEAPTNAGTYTANITLGEATASVEYTIAPKAVTVSGITASDKTYDGNITATLNTAAAGFDGKLDADTLTVSAAGRFDSANVGEGKTVTICNLTLDGNSKENYVLAREGHQTTTTATITAKGVGLQWTNTELTYNGKAQKPAAVATGLVDGDTCMVFVTGEQINVGENYTAIAESLSNRNYKLPENKTTTFKINRTNAVPAKVITNSIAFDRTEKPLVKITGDPVGGVMQYVLGTDAAKAPTEGWSASIPTGTEVGTYYVWYKVFGDENHNDSEPTCVTASISYNVYNVVADNLEWTRGSSSTLTITFKGKYEDTATYQKWLKTVNVDGTEIGTANYTAKSGSLVIDLKPAYLEKLSEGKHKLSVGFNDIEGLVTANFTVKAKSTGGGSSTPEKKTDNVVTCQMAGYPASYAWNEATKACQPGYIDANGVFRSTAKTSNVPNTYDKGVGGNAASLLIATVFGIGAAHMLRKYR